MSTAPRRPQLATVHVPTPATEAVPPKSMEGTPPRRMKLWHAADLHGEPTTWLMRGHLPLGQVAVLIGDEGLGKSLWWVLAASHITTGMANRLLGYPASPPRHVVVVVTEDSWGDVRDRLDVAGADLAYVHVICEDSDGSGTPSFPRHMDTVIEATAAHDVALIVVDAWLDTVPPNLSVRDPQQARQALDPWKTMATRSGASVLLVTHTNRTGAASLRDLYGATSALRQMGRITLFALPRPGEGNGMLLGSEKANGQAKDQEALTYSIEPVQVRADTQTDPGVVPRMRLVGLSGASVRQHLAAQRQVEADARRPPDTDERLRTWTRSYLTERGGEVPATEAQEAATKAGHSSRRVPAAVKSIGGYAGPGDGPGSAWVYRAGPGDE